MTGGYWAVGRGSSCSGRGAELQHGDTSSPAYPATTTAWRAAGVQTAVLVFSADGLQLDPQEKERHFREQTLTLRQHNCLLLFHMISQSKPSVLTYSPQIQKRIPGVLVIPNRYFK